MSNGHTNNSSPEVIQILRSYRAQATQLPVEHGAVKNKTAEQHAADLIQSMTADTAVGMDLNGVYVENSDRPVCHTGNGPTSVANAIFITLAFNNWDKLLDEIERLRDRLEAREKELSRLNSQVEARPDETRGDL